jgi:exopolysaccharide biosynthesis protein
MTLPTNSSSYVIEDNEEGEVQVKEFVNGLFGWLIKDNEIIPTKNDDDVFAPRTAIGVNSEGNLIIFQVDGCEHCPYHDKQRRGLTLYQMAAVMASMECILAINLDGGGSSTSTLNGEVINTPTCIDYIDWKCERPVSSVVCIKSDKTAQCVTSSSIVKL